MAITSWDSEGMNWSNPDLTEAPKYIEALRLACIEKLRVRYSTSVVVCTGLFIPVWDNRTNGIGITTNQLKNVMGYIEQVLELMAAFFQNENKYPSVFAFAGDSGAFPADFTYGFERDGNGLAGKRESPWRYTTSQLGVSSSHQTLLNFSGKFLKSDELKEWFKACYQALNLYRKCGPKIGTPYISSSICKGITTFGESPPIQDANSLWEETPWQEGSSGSGSGRHERAYRFDSSDETNYSIGRRLLRFNLRKSSAPRISGTYKLYYQGPKTIDTDNGYFPEICSDLLEITSIATKAYDASVLYNGASGKAAWSSDVKGYWNKSIVPQSPDVNSFGHYSWSHRNSQFWTFEPDFQFKD